MPPSEGAVRAAHDFFIQLDEFSKRAFDKMRLPEVSPWGANDWPEGNPKGAILHYTADDALDKAVRWFMTPEFHARASSHVVVGDRKVPWMNNLAADLPLIQALPVTVIQCRRVATVSWHATWACSLTYGIEATNIGQLRPNDAGGFNCWFKETPGAPDWTTPWKGAAPINVFGKWFCPWVPDQVRTIFHVLRHVYASYAETFRKPWVLGHEQVQGNRTRQWDSRDAPHYTTDKLDPGLHFPLNEIREALFAGVDIEDMAWFQKFSADQATYAVSSRDASVMEWVNAGGCCMDAAAAWSAFKNQISILPSIGGEFGSVGKLALRLLGYHVSNVTDEDLDSDDYQTISIFQRLQGLDTDGKPGPHTRQALLERLRDRGLM